MSQTQQYQGHVTRIDGSHKPLSCDEAKALWEAMDRAEDQRAAAMPKTVDALQTICFAKERLRELGWREAQYCPKNGDVFAVIEWGCSGMFAASYLGEWPTGNLLYCDSFTDPARCMFKALDALTDDERALLRECDAREKQMADREMGAFAALTEDPYHD